MPILLTGLTLAAALGLSAGRVEAFEDTDFLSGSDRFFDAGHEQEVFTETFHKAGGDLEKYREDQYKEEQKNPLDRWRFTKSFGFGELYDTNINLDYHDPKSENILNSYSTFGVSRHGDRTWLKAFYNMAYTQYVRDGRLSRFNQGLGVDYTRRFNKLTIRIGDNFKPDTSAPQGERTELVPEITDSNRVTFYSNAFNVDLNYQYSPKTRLDFAYANSLLLFPKSTGVDNTAFSTMTHSFKPQVNYKIAPKTNLFLDYRLSIAEYIDGPTPTTYQQGADFGVSTQISPKMGAAASIGYSYMDLNTDGTPAIKDVAYNVALSRKITEKVQATVSADHKTSRDFDTSLGQPMGRSEDAYNFNLSWKATQKISVDAQAGALYSSREGFITLPDLDNPAVSYTREEDNQTYKWGLKMNWTPRQYLTFILLYEYLNRNSSFKDFEYDGQKLAATLSCVF